MDKELTMTALFCILQCCVGVVFAQASAGAGRRVLSVNMGQPGCGISVTDFYGGHLESGMPKNASYWTDVPPVHSTLDKFSIDFECQINREFDEAAQNFGAQWNEREKIWGLYYEDENDKKILPPVSRIYQIRSINAVGFLRTTDQINGDEAQRVRFYSFCLFHGKAAVCGTGQSMRLEEPKGNYLPAIMRILRSVSFVE
jgi:hypothetical protein